MISLPFDDVAASTTCHSLELGAGRNPVGPAHFSPCVVSDGTWFHGLAVVCLAEVTAFPDASFDRVVMCNPYKYGFSRKTGPPLLRELVRVLRPNGHIVIIGGKANPFCDPSRIRHVAASFSTPQRPLVVDDERISARGLFPGHRFERTDGSETRPNWRTTITVGQPK